MRSFFLLGVLMAAVPALADEGYETDREAAIAAFTPELGKNCLDDFAHKSRKDLVPLGALAFNEPLSREVYRMMYWSGSDRGVAFTMPVKTQEQGREVAGNVACFYAVDAGRLHFQLSQQVITRLL